MNTEEFTTIIEAQIERSLNTLVTKAEEYAADNDRLYNFKQAAHLQGITPRQAIGGMMVKHTVSVYDMIANPEVTYSDEYINEKIGDEINYLLLLRAEMEEEKKLNDPDREALDRLRTQLRGEEPPVLDVNSLNPQPASPEVSAKYRAAMQTEVNLGTH